MPDGIFEYVFLAPDGPIARWMLIFDVRLGQMAHSQLGARWVQNPDGPDGVAPMDPDGFQEASISKIYKWGVAAGYWLMLGSSKNHTKSTSNGKNEQTNLGGCPWNSLGVP